MISKIKQWIGVQPKVVVPREDVLPGFHKVMKFIDCDKTSRYVVYQLTTFPQKRIYVGSTTNYLWCRCHDHLKDARTNDSSVRVIQAIKESDYVEVTILYQSPIPLAPKHLQDIEKTYIRSTRDTILASLPPHERANIAAYFLNMRPDGRFL